MSVDVALVPFVPTASGESPFNSIAIRESSFGQYLESINTGGTWFQRMQQTLGYSDKPLTALDALYVTTGVAGAAILAIPLAAGATLTFPVLAVGTVLTAISAIGMNEEDRRQKIGAGIVGGTLIVFQPSAAAFVVKEAYSATKETVKQTAELAKTGIGFTTAALGFGTSVVALVIVKRETKKK